MKTIDKILLILSIIISVSALSAQTVCNSKGYQTNFEDDSERGLWTLNAGQNGEKCANKWYWGKPGANDGEYGLFVSNDNGASVTYKNTGVSVIAYRKFSFDAGLYEFSFDWQAGGRFTDGLYACWIPASDTLTVKRLASVTTSSKQEWIDTYGLYFGTDSLRRGQRTWNTIADTIRSDGQQEYYLVFVWNNGVLDAYQPAVSIDNILIMEYGRCERPTQLSVSIKGDDAILSWQGTADAYDVRCVNNMTGEKIEFFDVAATSQEITGLPEGMCTYYVRSKCSGVAGSWVSISKFLFYPAVRCIDYLNLSQSNCFFGTTDNPKAFRGVIDYGYQAMESRHTIHWNPMERDPHTNGKLKTVPDGEIASVRLGNWDVNAEAETVEYNYIVDTTTSAILLLNYAVVLQDPGHDSLAQPRFTLQILHNDQPLDKFGCGEAFFSAGFNTDGWEQFDGGWWKDWTTVAINLAAYHKQSLKIRLTTLDCTQSGHFGYAYFTLGCSDGKIKGLSCGDSPENVFQAPEGFNYRWYLPENPEDVLSTEQTFIVPSNDTLTYLLDVIQPTNVNCYYTLSASAVGRWPRAYTEYSQSVYECKNLVTFDNKSYVKRINQISLDSFSTVEPCETYLWDFGDGTTSTERNPKHIFPEEGGTYQITLLAGIANDACQDDTTFTITLPKIGTTRDTTHAVICRGDSYSFGEKFYFTTGCYSDTITSSFGCDSIFVLDLFVSQPFDSIIYDTICSHEEYLFDGKILTETGKYTAKFKNIYGCDSSINVNLVVNQTLYIDFDSIAVGCIDDYELYVPYNITSGNLFSYDAIIKSTTTNYDSLLNLEPKDNNIVIPLPSEIKPGKYNIELLFGENSCGESSEVIPLEVYYSKDILVQRWGDVLAVKNQDYNGGYEFVAFQWFKNGQLIEGATSSVLYVEGGIDLNDRYSVLLTRKDDNLSLMTCDALLVDNSSLQESNIIVFAQSDDKIEVQTKQNAKLKIWSLSGHLIKEVNIESNMTSMVDLDLHSMCIFEFLFEDKSREIRSFLINR